MAEQLQLRQLLQNLLFLLGGTLLDGIETDADGPRNAVHPYAIDFTKTPSAEALFKLPAEPLQFVHHRWNTQIPTGRRSHVRLLQQCCVLTARGCLLSLYCLALMVHRVGVSVLKSNCNHHNTHFQAINGSDG
ncbi:hypothetical protein HRbin36_02519 [bacterium HR36]|nr:hypothetical protein HRbin36_02519 [bacterium HR36]